MQGIGNNQNEIILSPPSSLFIIKCLADSYVKYANFLMLEIHAQENEKLLNYSLIGHLHCETSRINENV